LLLSVLVGICGGPVLDKVYPVSFFAISVLTLVLNPGLAYADDYSQSPDLSYRVKTEVNASSTLFERSLTDIQGTISQKIAKFKAPGLAKTPDGIKAQSIQSRSTCDFFINGNLGAAKILASRYTGSLGKSVLGFCPKYDYLLNNAGSPNNYTIASFTPHAKGVLLASLADRIWESNNFRSVFAFEDVDGVRLATLISGSSGSLIGATAENIRGKNVIRLEFQRAFRDSGKSYPLTVDVEPLRHYAIVFYSQTHELSVHQSFIEYNDDVKDFPFPKHILTQISDRKNNLIEEDETDLSEPVACAIPISECSLEAFGLAVPGSVNGRTFFLLINAALLIAAAIIFTILSRRRKSKMSAGLSSTSS
jgi:hypothetical protein